MFTTHKLLISPKSVDRENFIQIRPEIFELASDQIYTRSCIPRSLGQDMVLQDHVLGQDMVLQDRVLAQDMVLQDHVLAQASWNARPCVYLIRR